jgi:hypothetical protein
MVMERWKPVTGFDWYEVSTMGRLRKARMPSGKPFNYIISPHRKKSGYLDYWVWHKGVKTRFKAHTLIYTTFVGPVPDGHCINHKNGLKDDNRLANLEVMTLSENMKHSFRVLGRKPPNNPSPGEKNGSAKLTPEKVREIRRLCASGQYQYVVGRMFGVSQSAVQFIVNRRTWSHVD